jgi:hypothetical protein
MNANEQAYQRWAQNQVLTAATFWWKTKQCETEVRLTECTFNEALNIAKRFGFTEPRWYKPWTWGNGVVTVG